MRGRHGGRADGEVKGEGGEARAEGAGDCSRSCASWAKVREGRDHIRAVWRRARRAWRSEESVQGRRAQIWTGRTMDGRALALPLCAAVHTWHKPWASSTPCTVQPHGSRRGRGERRQLNALPHLRLSLARSLVPSPPPSLDTGTAVPQAEQRHSYARPSVPPLLAPRVPTSPRRLADLPPSHLEAAPPPAQRARRPPTATPDALHSRHPELSLPPQPPTLPLAPLPQRQLAPALAAYRPSRAAQRYPRLVEVVAAVSRTAPAQQTVRSSSAASSTAAALARPRFSTTGQAAHERQAWRSSNWLARHRASTVRKDEPGQGAFMNRHRQQLDSPLSIDLSCAPPV